MLETLSISNTAIIRFPMNSGPINYFPDLKLFDISKTKLDFIDVSNNTLLWEFNATNTPNFVCIKVNQDQLNNPPGRWQKDPEDVYSLDCN